MNDSGFESRLSRLMRDAADGAPTPKGLPKEIRTRARGRQIAIAFAALVLFSGVIGGTTVAVLTTTDGSQPIPPVRPPTVSPGDVDAKARTLISEAGNLCRAFDFQAKERIGDDIFRSVNCKVPGSIPIEVRFIVRTFPTQGARDTWLEESRSQMKLPFLVGPDWTLEIVDQSLVQPLRDRLGGTLIRSDTSPLPRSAPLTRDWTVASGRHRGYQWRYEAQLRSIDGNVTPCPGIGVEPLGGFGDCGITITRGGNVAYSHVSFDKAPRLSAVFGSVSDRVESVVIELSSGERVEAEMFAIPRRFGDELGSSDFRLFLVFPMPQSSGRPQGAVLAIDEEGEVTERIPLCSPQPDPPVSTCGS
jgi:hypothetical protein